MSTTTTSPAVARVLERVKAKRNGQGWIAPCPAHDDRKPSLSIKTGDDGRALVHCHAGCSVEDVLKAIDITPRDLFADDDRTPHNGNGRAKPKRSPIVAIYPYVDAQGVLLFEVCRRADKTFPQRRPDGQGGLVWNLDGIDVRPLYRLPDVLAAPAESFVFLAEGEKDADNCRDMGAIATTTSGGASQDGRKPKWPHTDLLPLHDRHVVLLPDNDDPGRAHMESMAAELHGKAASVRVLHLPGLPDKGDVSDWLAAGHDGEELVALAEACPLWAQTETPAVVAPTAEASDASASDAQLLPVSFTALAQLHPMLHEPVIDGLLRRGETCNIIAAPKVGKSWLVYDIALSIIGGRYWLATYPCKAGRVLLIDNELHPPTIAHRIPKVAQARHIEPIEYADKLDVLTLRGLGITMDRLQPLIDRIEAGYYTAIVGDAWYRFIPPGLNENSNADVMSLYNLLDRYAAATRAAWIVVHHASKGGQGEKSITDVGAGAGAQSRAADAHVILRPHEEPGHVVLEAAVRSFAPVEPIGLRWDFPVWTKVYDLDTGALKGRKTVSEERQDERDTDGITAIIEALSDGPMTTRQIRAAVGGIGKDRAERLLDRLESDRKVRWEPAKIRGGAGRIYTLIQPGTRPGTDHHTG